MAKEKKTNTMSWDAFQSLGNPDNAPEEIVEVESTDPSKRDRIRVYLERKGRGGKTVSIVKGLSLVGDSLADLSKHLKAKCGTGGYIENEEIVIQGDQRKKIIDFFLADGYKDVKNAGH